MSLGESVRRIRVEPIWRKDVAPDALSDAETELLQRYAAELLRDLLMLQEEPEQAEINNGCSALRPRLNNPAG